MIITNKWRKCYGNRQPRGKVVKRMVDARPALQDVLIDDIVNYASLAERLQTRVENEMGVDVKRSAIVMALRRYSETLKEKTQSSEVFKLSREIVMKTDICDVSILKTPSGFDKIKDVYDLVNYEKGETLNVIHGNQEITVVISQKHIDALLSILSDEKVLNIERDLVSVSLNLSKDFLYTPGILSLATRKLAWENINIFENISTMSELIFIISQKDAVRAYNAFQEMVSAPVR